MSLVVDDAVRARLPGMLLVVAAAGGIDNRAARPAIAEGLAAVAAALPAGWRWGSAQAHPHVAAWREALGRLGIPARKFPSAVESLTRRALAGKGAPRINPLVDLYNFVSLAHVVPVGGWDVDELAGGDILLRFTGGGERFRELGSEQTELAGPGELGYADREELITRHFVWRQSEKAKVTPSTRRVFMVSEILAAVGPAVAERVRESLASGLEEHFGVRPLTAVLGPERNRWDWQGV